MRYVQKVMLTSVLLLLVTALFPQGIPGIGQAYPKAQAAPWNPLEFLVPCGNENWVAGDSPAGQVCYVRGGVAGECTICDLVQLAQNIIRFLIYLGTILAVLMFVYAGVLYLQASASPGNVSKAHGIFMSTLIGLLVTLAAWLIIDTLMKTFYGDGGEWGPWNDILCDAGTAVPRYCVDIRTGVATIPGGGGLGGGGGGPVGAGRVSEDDARAQLAAAGINVWESAPGATKLHNMKQETLDVALDMKKACPTCEITVTGGTESGYHAGGTTSHAAGFKIDLEDTPSVNQHIESTWLPSGTRSDGSPQYSKTTGVGPSKSTTVCAKEGTHWDCLTI